MHRLILRLWSRKRRPPFSSCVLLLHQMVYFADCEELQDKNETVELNERPLFKFRQSMK